MRCVIYLRVSTREQAEKGEGEEGFSIPAQREACTRQSATPVGIWSTSTRIAASPPAPPTARH